MKADKEIVSVCMLTYNHGKFIGEALESVFSQKTTYPYKLVIGDDASTDNTVNIILKYSKKYPGKITLIKNNINIGVSANFKRTLAACQGKFIALLEGDDCWTSTTKIQQHVDFLINNNDYALCCNRVTIKDEALKNSRFSTLPSKTSLSVEDLAKENFIYTASCTFRNKLIKSYPDWLLDWPLFLMISKFGKIQYFTQVMSMYRRHSNGIWSQKGHTEKIAHAIELTELCDEYFKFELHKYFQYRLGPLYLEMANYLRQNGQKDKSNKYLINALKAYRYRNALDWLIGFRRLLLNHFSI